MLRMHRTIGVLAAALVALLIVGGALAQHDPPHRLFGFDGDVTIDGQNAAAGTELAAMAYGRVVGSTTVGTDGSWALDVPGGLEDVSIVVAGIETDGGYNTTRGGSTRVMRAVMTSTPTDGGDGGELEGDDAGSTMEEGDGGELEGRDAGSTMEEGDGGELEGDAAGSTMEEDNGSTSASGSQGSDNGFPGTGTGGLTDRSSAAGPVYGGLAATLALFALLVGLAVRRHARHSARA